MGFKGIFRFMSMRALEGTIAILILLFMPNVPPHCKFEKPYKVVTTRPLEGKLALNEKLNNAEIWHAGDFKGPEAFAVYNNELFTSLHSGDIVKLTGNKHITPVVQFGVPCKNEFEEKECGRPLGLAFDKNGFLYAADAYYGIFKVNVKTGAKELLVSPDKEINGKKPKIFNSIALTNAGDIYWTDSSTDFNLENGLFDLFADGTGRLMHYNSKTKENKVLLSNLHFANGVLLSKNEEYLLISETARSRVHRYYLKGTKAGTSDIFIDGLPGMPDNLSHDEQGGYFIPLVASHDDSNPSPTQIFGSFPLARKLIARVMGLVELIFSFYNQIYPNDFAKTGVYFIGHFQSGSFVTFSKRFTLIRINENGDVIESFHSTNGKLSSISEAFIYNDHLLLGSPFQTGIGRVPLKEIGLEASVKHTPEIKQEPLREKRDVPEVKATPTKAPKPQTPPPTQAPKPQTPPPTQAPKPQTPPPTQAAKPQTPPPTQAPKPQTPPPTEAPKPQTPPPTQAPKPQTPPPTQAPIPQTPPPTQAPKPQTPPPTEAPKPQTPPPTQAPKPQTPPPTQAPKPQTPPPTQAPKPETPPPTEAPKPQTPPPTQAPKPQTPPPTQAPKPQTPPPTEAPKPQTPPPTQAPKPQTPPPTQAPKPQTPPPTEAPKPQTPPPTQAPKPQTPPPTEAPKPQTPPPTQAPKPQTPPPTEAPKPQTPPPTQAPKPQTPPPTQAPKPQTPPPQPNTPPPTQAPKPQTPPPTQAPKPQTAPPTQAPTPQTKAPEPNTPPPPTQAPPPPTKAPNPQTPQPAPVPANKDAAPTKDSSTSSQTNQKQPETIKT